jgi:transcriptional regulator with XRE-family HTH domain
MQEFSLESFPRNLRDTMHKVGITSTAFAKELSVTRMSVYNWRAGRTDPTLIRLFQIASVLKTDVGQLLNSQQQ